MTIRVTNPVSAREFGNPTILPLAWEPPGGIRRRPCPIVSARCMPNELLIYQIRAMTTIIVAVVANQGGYVPDDFMDVVPSERIFMVDWASAAPHWDWLASNVTAMASECRRRDLLVDTKVASWLEVIPRDGMVPKPSPWYIVDIPLEFTVQANPVDTAKVKVRHLEVVRANTNKRLQIAARMCDGKMPKPKAGLFTWSTPGRRPAWMPVPHTEVSDTMFAAAEKFLPKVPGVQPRQYVRDHRQTIDDLLGV